MTRLALLWHMHQPFYEDLATGEHILPWVRLHAVKDYWGMAAVLREFPDLRVTFNLVPSLLVQIKAFAEGRAKDYHLEIGLKPAERLDPAERAFLIANGFHAPVERMIKPYPRYAELHARRDSPDSYDEGDLRDLQVLHKLAWMDPDWLTRDRRLIALVAKQRGYTEEDKQALHDVELELLNAVIPIYRELSSAGRIELSTSPFYHAILPLLCDLEVHLERHPESSLPRGVFAHPEDAIEQVRRAIDFHRQLFGTPPAGVWPAEGALSAEVLGILADLGCAWTATDEDLLARSLNRHLSAETLYRPYAIGPPDRTIRCLFRDHTLSDLVGFTYQSWPAEAAAVDFLARVRAAGQRFATQVPKGSGEAPTVTVILDGENAWEHYEGGGRPFLRALYTQLQTASDIETVTMAEAAAGAAQPLASIAAGSWIDADFYVWAGHPDDHRAWRQLSAARDAFDRHGAAVSPDQRDRAREELLIAEGSDWFWWYGDDRSSEHDREFDDLFRRHIRNVYRRLALTPPDELFVTNITTEGPAVAEVRLPQLMTPTIDGTASSFLEWAAAARVRRRSGAMHRAARLLGDVSVGANRTSLFLLLEGPEVAARVASGEIEIWLVVERPARRRLRVGADRAASPYFRAGSVVEIAASFGSLGVQAGDRATVGLVVTDAAGLTVEEHPPFEVDIPNRHLEAGHWRVW